MAPVWLRLWPRLPLRMPGLVCSSPGRRSSGWWELESLPASGRERRRSEFVNVDTVDQEGDLYLVSHDSGGQALAAALEPALAGLGLPDTATASAARDLRRQRTARAGSLHP